MPQHRQGRCGRDFAEIDAMLKLSHVFCTPQTLPTRIIEPANVTLGLAAAITSTTNAIAVSLQPDGRTMLVPGRDTLVITVPYEYDALWVDIPHEPDVANITLDWASIPGCNFFPIPDESGCSDIACNYTCVLDQISTRRNYVTSLRDHWGATHPNYFTNVTVRTYCGACTWWISFWRHGRFRWKLYIWGGGQ